MKRKPIKNPDTKCEDYSYWNEVLVSHGLSTRRGEFPQRTLPDGIKESLGVFVGTSEDLVGIEEDQERKKIYAGRKTPEGHGPDHDE
jgi:hypothetical protein